MIRNLKVLLLAAMAVAAFGAFSVSGAQAAEFHCSVEPCSLTTKADGTAKNSHQVFIVTQGAKSAATTCNTISGESTGNAKTATSVTLTNVKYEGCNVAGAPSTVNMNGCHYKFNNTNTVNVICPAEKSIEITVTETGCAFKIGAQGPLAGIGYATIGTTPNREVTVSTNVTGITGTANNKCGSIEIAEGAVTGDYTTGNTIVTGESAGGVMADAWYL